MTQSPIASGLLRLTVASGTRRVDLMLPGAVPVAELLPELARSVGLLDAATVHGGYRVVTADGRRLATDTGLTLQGVEDGGLLTITAGVDVPVPRVYDDVVEAMTDAVEEHLAPWRPAAGRRTALIAAALLLGLGALALLEQRGAALAPAAAIVVALALCTGAVVLSRVQVEAEAAVSVAWLGTVYAAVAGILLAPEHTPLLAAPLAAAGGGALLAGLLCLVGLDEGRVLVLPPVVLGALAVVIGLAMRPVAADSELPARVVVTALTVIVLIGSVFPWLALGATRTKVDPMFSHADITAEPADVVAAQVTADARTAHEILLAITGAVGTLLVLTTPLAVGLGLAGTLLAVDAALILMLRTRQYRTGSEVMAGLIAGIAGLAIGAVSVLVLHHDWRPTLAVVLAVAGAGLLAATLLPAQASVRRGRLGDLLETIALLALVPLLIVAIGVFSWLQGKV